MQIEEILKEIEEYKQSAEQLKGVAQRINSACTELDKAWSQSNLTNHAKFYFGEYEEPTANHRFSKEWGLLHGIPNGWKEYTNEEVTAEIDRRAGASAEEFKEQSAVLDDNFLKLKRKIQLWLTESALTDEAIEKYEPKSATDFFNDLTPRQHMTRDMEAISSGTYIVPHTYFKAVAMYVLNLPNDIEELEFLLNKQVVNSKTSPQATPFDFWRLIHPKIRAVSEQKFNDGYYMDAVRSGFIEFNAAVKHQYKTDVNVEEDGFNLMKLAFGDFVASDANFPNTLKYPVIDLTDRSGKNFQKGFSLISAGSMLGLRNPRAHSNNSDEIDEAIHLIFLASWLMYKVFDDKGVLKTP